MRVDGYGGDPIDHDYVLNLIVSDYSYNNEVEVINRADVESLCKSCKIYLKVKMERYFLK